MKSFGVSGVSADKIVTWFMDQSYLEHGFYVPCTKEIFWDRPLWPRLEIFST